MSGEDYLRRAGTVLRSGNVPFLYTVLLANQGGTERVELCPCKPAREGGKEESLKPRRASESLSEHTRVQKSPSFERSQATAKRCCTGGGN